MTYGIVISYDTPAVMYSSITGESPVNLRWLCSSGHAAYGSAVELLDNKTRVGGKLHCLTWRINI